MLATEEWFIWQDKPWSIAGSVPLCKQSVGHGFHRQTSQPSADRIACFQEGVSLQGGGPELQLQAIVQQLTGREKLDSQHREAKLGVLNF